ncbi:TRAP transporter small permease subunit [Halodurantibacterium flavum]|uniref:TRAP transporter small permease protein n=1 Tax=Halodurantibacterium flavum TaxID=1382802 RepID=A0ABW4S0V1_9RHOB
MTARRTPPAPESTPGQSTAFSFLIDPVDRLTGLGQILAGLCLLGIFLLIGSEIVMRNLFRHSLHFSWDVSAYLMGACFMLASASALRSGSHVRVTALLETLPRAAARALEFAACLVALVIAGALAWALTDMARLSYLRGATSATVMRVPLVWPQTVLAAGSLLLCLQLFAQFLRLLRGESLPRGQGLD